MRNNVLFALFSICLILTLIGGICLYFNPFSEFPSSTVTWTYPIGNFIGLLLLITNGQTRKTWFVWPLIAFVGILIIGSSFKLMDWPSANQILLFGGSGISIFYIGAFLIKRTKKLLDYGKVLWVLIATVGALLKVFHIIDFSPVILRDLLLILLVVGFATEDFQNPKKKPEPKPEPNYELEFEILDDTF